jgi:quercetin dioxygenase-like cupin family protein
MPAERDPAGGTMLGRTPAQPMEIAMEILPKPPTTKAPTERFTGDAWMDLIVRGDPPSRVRASFVRFAPGSRNAWHVHAVGQTLHVLDGIGRTQARGGEVLEIRPGDTIHTPPGEWHWHGASPERFLTHLTIYEAADDGSETEWGDKVSDEEYGRLPADR